MHATLSGQGKSKGWATVALTAALFLLPGISVAADQTGGGAAKQAAAAARKVSPHRGASLTSSATRYYQSLWGVDNFLVRSTASGSLIRFSYRVLDPARADVLNDARNTPRLIDPKRGLELTIPTLEKVGQLRQKGTPVAGMEYWMMFSNKGLPVKVGDRVNVVIGSFHADGLVVE